MRCFTYCNIFIGSRSSSFSMSSNAISIILLASVPLSSKC